MKQKLALGPRVGFQPALLLMTEACSLASLCLGLLTCAMGPRLEEASRGLDGEYCTSPSRVNPV